MNKKEISELSRRFKPEKANIGRIYGCYVNGSSKEVISYSNEAKSIFAQNVPENGTLEQMLKDYYPQYNLSGRETATDAEEFYDPRSNASNESGE